MMKNGVNFSLCIKTNFKFYDCLNYSALVNLTNAKLLVHELRMKRKKDQNNCTCLSVRAKQK